ncbi:hypothetical protein EJ110_NYTH28858 [Nymphaea thermarum]|nr:hypothetical protein EJ110_NYTH28858 [Nymphaea thermarum]
MEISSQKALTLTHFSHAHPLHLSQMDDNGQKENPRCGGCHEECSSKDGVYACLSCPYFLHSECADLPREIRHPADELHPLALLAVPPYPGEVFSCSACRQICRGFLYRCAACCLDVHPRCARLLACVQHPSHKHALEHKKRTCRQVIPFANSGIRAQVDCVVMIVGKSAKEKPARSTRRGRAGRSFLLLTLATKTAYGGLGFICDLCVRHGRKQWYYRRKPCGFELHTECALKESSKSSGKSSKKKKGSKDSRAEKEAEKFVKEAVSEVMEEIMDNM